MRNLTVAEVRAAETAPVVAVAWVPLSAHRDVSQRVRAGKREAVLTLHTWVKQQPHLKAVPLKDGEPSVALLLLWEADHHKIFPCGKSDIKSRVLNFTKSLVGVVAADTELSGWLHHKKERMMLPPGLRYNSYTRWTVQIQPAVGEPFLGAWKAYLRTVLQQQQAPVAPRQRGSSDEESGPTPKASQAQYSGFSSSFSSEGSEASTLRGPAPSTHEEGAVGTPQDCACSTAASRGGWTA